MQPKPTLRLRPFVSNRLLAVALTAAYVAVFFLTYRDVIAPVFAFWGLGFREIPPAYFWSAVILCVAPSLWMPVEFTRPSQLLFYLQYFVIFIPASFIVYYSTRPALPLDLAARIGLMMFMGLLIMQTAYVLPLRAIRVLRLTPSAFWLLFTVTGAILLGYVVVRLSANFQLANFDEIYSLRYAMAELIAQRGTRFGLYAQYLLLSLFLPVVFAVGAFRRNWWMIALAGFLYVFLFGVAAVKSAILAVIYLPAVYLLVSRPKHTVSHFLTVGLMLGLVGGFLTQSFLERKGHVFYLGLLHFRLIAVPALTVVQYADFFQTHPVTHLAHVTGFNWMLQNPYDTDIPYMIGHHYFHEVVGANGGMWAGDGLVGFGLWGIPLISCVCALLFWILDSVTADVDPALVAVAVAYAGISFMNVSLFTTLITGGLAFLIFAFALAPVDARGGIKVPALRMVPRTVAAPSC